MTDVDIREYGDYDEFAQDWQVDANGVDLQLRWQLLGQLDADEVLVVLPEWLAEEKVGFVDGSTPTEFVGRVGRETEKAIRLDGATATRPLVRLAHRIQSLEEGLANAGDDDDRREWLERRLESKRREFADREEMTGLGEEWLPKSQLIQIVRRKSVA